MDGGQTLLRLVAGPYQDFAVQAVAAGGQGQRTDLGLYLRQRQTGELPVQGHRGQQPVRARVVDLSALPADGDPLVAEVVEYVPGPGHGPAGDDDVRSPRRGGGEERFTGAFRDGVVATQQRAVEIGRDELVRERGRAHLEIGSRNSRPPRYGRSTWGTRTLPSACWWFSRMATIVRGTAHRVPFSVDSGWVFLPSR